MKQQQSSSAVIRHEGRVLSVTSVQTKVEILAQTACAACHAKAVCGASNGESRVITIRREDDGKIRPEDRVNVVIRQGQGFKAVFIAYLIPLFILLGGTGIRGSLLPGARSVQGQAQQRIRIYG